MAIPTDEAILDDLRQESIASPAVSYLQRRYCLPYRRAAMLRERFLAMRFVDPPPLDPSELETRR